MAKSLARIHRQNLINYGILPLLFEVGAQLEGLKPGARVELEGVREAVRSHQTLTAEVEDFGPVNLRLKLSKRDRQMLLAGGRIPWFRRRRPAAAGCAGSAGS